MAVMTFQYRQQNPPPSRQRVLFSAGALPRLVSFRADGLVGGRWRGWILEFRVRWGV